MCFGIIVDEIKEGIDIFLGHVQEDLLGVGAHLGDGAGSNLFLNFGPISSIFLNGGHEAVVFGRSPASVMVFFPFFRFLAVFFHHY